MRVREEGGGRETHAFAVLLHPTQRVLRRERVHSVSPAALLVTFSPYWRLFVSSAKPDHR